MAPYAEYADAFRFTAVVKLDGRSGSAGAEEDEDDGVVAVLLEGSVDVPAGFAPAPAPAAAALSHGFGGDGEAIFTYALVQNMCLARPRGLMCDVGGEVWGFQHRELFAVPTT